MGRRGRQERMNARSRAHAQQAVAVPHSPLLIGSQRHFATLGKRGDPGAALCASLSVCDCLSQKTERARVAAINHGESCWPDLALPK